MRRFFRSRILALLGALGLGACAHSTIDGTVIEDTDDNRAIYELLGKLAEGLRARNVEQVLGLVAPSYFEDMGTVDTADDYGFHELKEKVLPETLAATEELYVDMQVHEIAVEGDSAHADLRYAARARVRMSGGDSWTQAREFNRVELLRIDGRWWIVAGL